jgi:hypothetical protein
VKPRAILDADMMAVGAWLLDGYRWWLAELSELVPPRLRQRGASHLPVVRYEPAAGLFRVRPGEAAAPIAYGAPMRAKIVIPAELCLLRRIERPAVAERDLGRMLALDRDRIMPVGADAMLIGGCVIARQPDAERVTIDVAGLPVARARALIDALAAMRCAPARIIVDRAHADGAEIDLLPAVREAGLDVGARRGGQYWWLVLAFLFLLNLWVMIWRDASSTAQLEQLVEDQQPAVSAAHRIAGRIAHANRIAAATIDRRRQEPLQLLDRIALALPPGAWVQRLSWSGEGLRLAGYRPRNADVAGALRRRAGLVNVNYSNAEASATESAGEPFEITARLAGH